MISKNKTHFLIYYKKIIVQRALPKFIGEKHEGKISSPLAMTLYGKDCRLPSCLTNIYHTGMIDIQYVYATYM